MRVKVVIVHVDSGRESRRTVQLERSCDDRFGPVRRGGQVRRAENSAAFHVQHRFQLWCSSGCGVCVRAVVIHVQGGEVGKQRDEVETAMFVAPMNVLCRDVVPTSPDSGLHTGDVQFRTGQSHVPDVELDILLGGFRKEAGDGISAQGGLKGKIQTLFDRLLQQPEALAPGYAVGFSLCEGRVFFSEGAGRFIRIEIRASVLTDGRAADAALPRSIDAGQHMNTWQPGGAHACLRSGAGCFLAALTAARPSSAGEA